MSKISLQLEKEKITFKEVFERFIYFKQVNNLSEQSLKYYTGCYNNFILHFPEDSLCENLTPDIVYDFIPFLRERNKQIKDVTVNSYLRGMRAILYFGMERGYIPEFKLHLIKADKELKEPYTDEELGLLLKKPDIKKCTFVEYRTWVIINYFLGTGNRASTALNLHNEDIRYYDNQIFMRKTKNRKQQLIPLSTSLAKILKEYSSYRKGNPDDYLFCTENGLQLSLRGLQTSIKFYNSKRGVARTSIHLFRHRFAKDWILNGGDMFRLQDILGHSDLSIVKEYISLYANDLHIQFNEFNPLEQYLKKTEGERIILRK